MGISGHFSEFPGFPFVTISNKPSTSINRITSYNYPTIDGIDYHRWFLNIFLLWKNTDMKQHVFFTGWTPIFHQPAATATRSGTFFMRLLVIHGANVRATADPVQRSKNRCAIGSGGHSLNKRCAIIFIPYNNIISYQYLESTPPTKYQEYAWTCPKSVIACWHIIPAMDWDMRKVYPLLAASVHWILDFSISIY